MKVSLLITLFFISFKSFAMCEYPHNPPVLCISGKVESVKSIKHSSYGCRLRLKVLKAVRPGKTYSFNSNLDRVEYNLPTSLKMKNVNLYSKGNCSKKLIKTIAEYNCNDRIAEFPDMSLLDAETLKAKIRDPWTEKKSLIDCSELLSK